MVAASVGEEPRSRRIGARWSAHPKAAAVLSQNARVTQRNAGSRSTILMVTPRSVCEADPVWLGGDAFFNFDIAAALLWA
jgi:hypothetical protein